MRSAYFAASALLLAGCSAAAAQADVPDLVGVWDFSSDVAIIVKEGEKDTLFSKVAVRFKIVEQDGPLIRGHELSQDVADEADPAADEMVVGAFTADGRLEMVDENGRHECTVTSADRLDCIYWHITDRASVVGRTVWARASE